MFKNILFSSYCLSEYTCIHPLSDTLHFSTCLFKTPTEKAQSALIGLQEKYDAPSGLRFLRVKPTLKYLKPAILSNSQQGATPLVAK